MIIHLVIRHQGQYDDYRSDPIKAFKNEEKAKEFAHLCKQEADRIIDEILVSEREHNKDGVCFFEKITELYMTHKYDPDMNDYDNIDYTVAELELE